MQRLSYLLLIIAAALVALFSTPCVNAQSARAATVITFCGKVQSSCDRGKDMAGGLSPSNGPFLLPVCFLHNESIVLVTMYSRKLLD